MGTNYKSQFAHYLNDTNIILGNIEAKYGKDHISYKLVEDLQEEVIEAVRERLRRETDDEVREYFFRAHERLQDIIRDYKL